MKSAIHFLLGFFTAIGILIVGCTALKKDPVILSGGHTPLGRVDARLETISSNNANPDLVREQADKGRIDVKQAADEQTLDLKSQQEVIDARNGTITDLTNQLNWFKNKWFTKWGLRIETFFKWWIILVIISIVARYAAVFVPVGFGSVLSWGSTIALNVLFCFVPSITGLADNIYFRTIGKKKEETPT